MAYYIQKTNEITKRTIYYNGATVDWTDNNSLKYMFDTQEQAQTKITEKKLYGGLVVSEWDDKYV